MISGFVVIPLLYLFGVAIIVNFITNMRVSAISIIMKVIQGYGKIVKNAVIFSEKKNLSLLLMTQIMCRNFRYYIVAIIGPNTAQQKLNPKGLF